MIGIIIWKRFVQKPTIKDNSIIEVSVQEDYKDSSLLYIRYGNLSSMNTQS